MIDVMIIEDDGIIRGLLKKMIEKNEGFRVVYEAATAGEAVEEYSANPVELAFVDIDLAGESGIECAKALCDINPKVKIVFATAHSEYMADAFEIYAFDYIVKPFNIERLNRTLNRIKEISVAERCMNPHRNSPEAVAGIGQDKLVIKGREEIYFIDTDDIIYIERVNGSTRIVLASGICSTGISLSELYEKLDSGRFLRSHRSYIINLTKIVKLTQYGRWTYNVSFKDCDASALMTYENYEKLKQRL